MLLLRALLMFAMSAGSLIACRKEADAPKPPNLLPPLLIDPQDGDVNGDDRITQDDLDTLALATADTYYLEYLAAKLRGRLTSEAEIDIEAARLFAGAVILKLRDLKPNEQLYVVFWDGIRTPDVRVFDKVDRKRRFSLDEDSRHWQVSDSRQAREAAGLTRFAGSNHLPPLLIDPKDGDVNGDGKVTQEDLETLPTASAEAYLKSLAEKLHYHLPSKIEVDLEAVRFFAGAVILYLRDSKPNQQLYVTFWDGIKRTGVLPRDKSEPKPRFALDEYSQFWVESNSLDAREAVNLTPSAS